MGFAVVGDTEEGATVVATGELDRRLRTVGEFVWEIVVG